MKILGVDTSAECLICKEFKYEVIHLLSGKKTHKYICFDCISMMYGLLLTNKQVEKLQPQTYFVPPFLNLQKYGTGNFPPFNIPSTGDPLPEPSYTGDPLPEPSYITNYKI